MIIGILVMVIGIINVYDIDNWDNYRSNGFGIIDKDYIQLLK